RHLARFFRRATRQRGERVGFLVGEAGERAEAARELDRVLVVLAAEAAEVEDRVDGALELERALASGGIGLGEAPEPIRAHLHVRDFVGEHPVLAELEHRVVRLAAALLHRVEYVDRQPSECALDYAQAETL